MVDVADDDFSRNPTLRNAARHRFRRSARCGRKAHDLERNVRQILRQTARDFEPFFVLVKDDVEHLVDEMEEGPERAQRAVDQGFVAGGFEAPEFGFIAAPRDRKNDR